MNFFQVFFNLNFNAMYVSQKFLILMTIVSLAKSWDLRPLNVSSFSIVHVTIYCNRAYLSIESKKHRKSE